MKKFVKNVALLTSLLLGGGNAWAVDVGGSVGRGNLTFKGSVVGSCVVKGQNMVHDIGTLSASLVPGTSKYEKITVITDVIDVSSCDSSVKKINVTPSYTPATSYEVYGCIENAGTAGNVMAQLRDAVGGTYYNNGVTRSFNVAKGAASIPFNVDIITDQAKKPTAGTMDFAAQFVIDFE
ncbi:hypothetical protein JOU96_004727 [Salmonella enterica]|nr:hypothetical protein [Salmonella enterica]EHD9191787.1 hypothetical protein [Salmonella enterica]EJN0489781.1 hypothetical protein [Salmonella enterica]EKA0060041.1 hypothetical protein [Salmonella enterica]EKB3296199.1 hypothetical protein [Salmonella enterica]